MQEKIRPGYKQTEAGVIPDDWEIRQLSDHFTIYAGGDVPKHSFSKIKTSAYPYPIFANALQNKGLYGYTGEKRSRADSLTVTGRGFLGHAEYRDEPFFPIVRLLVLEPCGALDAKFTTYAINERVEFAIESTGVPQLTAPQIAKYCIAAPADLDEQQLIVSALSDADARIAALEALIAKKRDLKQAAKQQLLTGKTRLPGFSGDWEATNFSSLVRHHSGNSSLIKGKLSSVARHGLYPAFSASGQDVWCERAEQVGEAIIVSAVGSRCGKSFHASGSWTAIANTHVVWPIAQKASLDFLMCFMNDEDFWLKSGSGQPFVLFKQSFNRPIALPKIDEQIAIAEVLSDMDAELVALDAEAEKARTIKQGMMQNLLTGKVRLV